MRCRRSSAALGGGFGELPLVSRVAAKLYGRERPGIPINIFPTLL